MPSRIPFLVFATSIAVACTPAAAPSASSTEPAASSAPAPAGVDAKKVASAHFGAGMKLIAAGDYDGGIAELEQAQKVLPHPNTLFNIAKANEQGGHKARAIQAYDEYLATNPSDRADVEAHVKELKASGP
jgi:iron complex outermembrane receptor protein